MKAIQTTIYLSLCFMPVAQANTGEEEQPGADFLEFLAEVEDATGDRFESWLETETAADSLPDTHNEPKK